MGQALSLDAPCQEGCGGRRQTRSKSQTLALWTVLSSEEVAWSRRVSAGYSEEGPGQRGSRSSTRWVDTGQ